MAGRRGTTLAEGNALLPAFMADYNTRSAKLPANSKDLHRRLGVGDDLKDAFTWKEERTLSQALTLQYDNVIFILEQSDQVKAAIGKRVTVVDYPDGQLAIRYKGVGVAYRTFDKVAPGLRRARLSRTSGSAPLSPMIREQQLERRGAASVKGAAPTRSARCPSIQSRVSLSTSRASCARSVEQRVWVRAPVHRATVGRCASLGLRARPPPETGNVTFLNGTIGDISKWWTHQLRASGFAVP